MTDPKTPDVQPSQLLESIVKAMKNYHMKNQSPADPEGDFMLVDCLTPEWEKTIKIGEDELQNLAEHIYDNLILPEDARTPAEPSITIRELRELCEGMKNPPFHSIGSIRVWDEKDKIHNAALDALLEAAGKGRV